MIKPITDFICKKLNIEQTGFVVMRSPLNYVAMTIRPPNSNVPCVVMSQDLMTRSSILAHEITHALLMTPWLFLAEGMATWIGIEVAGNCHDYLFIEEKLDCALRNNIDCYIPLQECIQERLSNKYYFNENNLHDIKYRYNFIVAASFLSWFSLKFPSFPAYLQQNLSNNPMQLLQNCSGRNLLENEQLWFQEVLDR